VHAETPGAARRLHTNCLVRHVTLSSRRHVYSEMESTTLFPATTHQNCMQIARTWFCRCLSNSLVASISMPLPKLPCHRNPMSAAVPRLFRSSHEVIGPRLVEALLMLVFSAMENIVMILDAVTGGSSATMNVYSVWICPSFARPHKTGISFQVQHVHPDRCYLNAARSFGCSRSQAPGSGLH